MTLWAYKLPKTEVTIQPDGVPLSVTTKVAGERPAFKLSGVKGQRYTVTCALTGAERRGRIILIDPFDNVADGPADAECGPGGSFTTDPLTVSGIFRLKTHFFGDGTGTFTVTVKPSA